MIHLEQVCCEHIMWTKKKQFNMGISFLFSGLNINPFTITKICRRWIWNRLGKRMDNFYIWKYNKLKTVKWIMSSAADMLECVCICKMINLFSIHISNSFLQIFHIIFGCIWKWSNGLNSSLQRQHWHANSKCMDGWFCSFTYTYTYTLVQKTAFTACNRQSTFEILVD